VEAVSVMSPGADVTFGNSLLERQVCAREMQKCESNGSRTEFVENSALPMFSIDSGCSRIFI